MYNDNKLHDTEPGTLFGYSIAGMQEIIDTFRRDSLFLHERVFVEVVLNKELLSYHTHSLFNHIVGYCFMPQPIMYLGLFTDKDRERLGKNLPSLLSQEPICYKFLLKNSILYINYNDSRRHIFNRLYGVIHV